MKQILMTSPVSFTVNYNINPWMEGQAGQVDRMLAMQQWTNLRNRLSDFADVIVLPKPPDNCPDAVFVANAGILHNGMFIPSRFKHPERSTEEPYFINWFGSHGFTVINAFDADSNTLPSFEGAGDALFSSNRNILWLGFGFRTSLAIKPILDSYFDDTNVVVRPLRLVDPRWYHLDTCFCPLDTGQLLWYPPAFDEHAQYVIESWFAPEQRIAVDEEDALNFACNAVSIGRDLVLPLISHNLIEQLTYAGLHVHTVPMSEFKKSGGACKCLTLEVNE